MEMHLTGGSTLMDFIAVLGGRYIPELKAVLGINSCVKFPPRFKAFLATDGEVSGMTVSREEFLGTYGSYTRPRAPAMDSLRNEEAGTEWLGASLRTPLSLEPGAGARVHFLAGVVDGEAEARRYIDKYLAPGAPDKAFEALTSHNKILVDENRVKTADPQFDRWLNVWLKHQLRFVGRWGRVIGRGYRDILQDVLGHAANEPQLARDCIKEVFSKQYPSGKAIRAWRLPTAQLDLQDYADSPSWMIMALSAYLKETADFSLLDEEVPFLNPEDPYAPSTSSATVWEHVLRAQRHLIKDIGRHGLTKIHYGDWCDTMNGVGAKGDGESVMLSMQVKWGCDLLAELAMHLKREGVANEMHQASVKMADAINSCAWDGKWYVRAFDDTGLPVGSDRPPAEDCGEGRIFLNAQSWALISGVADEDRRKSSVEMALKYLDTGYGMVLNWPAFTALRPRIGQMTAMTPGFYENGSVYVHGNCFWMFALAQTGMPQAAYRALMAILPDTDNKPQSDSEPFAIPNYYIGPIVKRRMQKNLYLSGWRTGSAAWVHKTAWEGLLGVIPEFGGLRIRPDLPEGWNGYQAVRRFRGDIFRIQVEGTGNGPWCLEMDGKPVEGDLIVSPGDGKEHTIRLTAG